MTTITKDKIPETTFIVYYQAFLAVAAVFVFFTRLDDYLAATGAGIIPLYWLMAFLIASLPLIASTLKKPGSIPVSIVIWSGVSLALPLISILLLPQLPNMQLLEDRFRSIIFLLLMLVIFSRHTLVLKWTKLAVLLVTVVNVCMYVYEFFNPLAYYFQQHAPGRASGFYIDSNAASNAVILGLILTIDSIKPKYRLFYALFALIGIVATFSRGGMLCWLLVVLILIFNQVIPRYQIPFLALAVFLSTTIVAANLNSLSYLKTDDGTELFRPDTLERVEFLVDPLGQEDSSSDSRIYYIEQAWSRFASSPFIGNGMGSGADPTQKRRDGAGQRSHNVYLDYMVEYGFLGALVYPLLLLATTWKAQGEHRKYAVTFVVYLLAWGFFSHTTMKLFFMLTAYAIMANLTKQSRWENL